MLQDPCRPPTRSGMSGSNTALRPKPIRSHTPLRIASVIPILEPTFRNRKPERAAQIWFICVLFFLWKESTTELHPLCKFGVVCFSDPRQSSEAISHQRSCVDQTSSILHCLRHRVHHVVGDEPLDLVQRLVWGKPAFFYQIAGTHELYA